jgi:hypothetical protein
MHIVLLGDSTLDNGLYTNGGPAIPDQLSEHLGSSGGLTMLAIDGSTTEDIPSQLARVPPSATHILLSIGGNDAMLQIDVLSRPSRSVSDALVSLAEVIADLERAYRYCLDRVVELGLPTTVCAIYNGAFPEESGEQTVISTALRAFNDVIFQAAFDHGVNVIDLRRVCSERHDFANPIEPNSVGGAKIAAMIHQAAQLEARSLSTVLPSGSSVG